MRLLLAFLTFGLLSPVFAAEIKEGSVVVLPMDGGGDGGAVLFFAADREGS